MSGPYYTMITDSIESGDIKKAYTLFRGFEAAGQLTDEEVESLQEKYGDPSLSREVIVNILAKVKKLDRIKLDEQLKKLDKKSWRRFRTDLNVAVFSD